MAKLLGSERYVGWFKGIASQKEKLGREGQNKGSNISLIRSKFKARMKRSLGTGSLNSLRKRVYTVRRQALILGFILILASKAHAAPVLLGSDVLEASNFKLLAGKKVGLVTNPSGVDRNGQSTIDALRKAPNVQLVSLFGPEHGVYGTVKAGVYFESSVDKRTGLVVYSLYGKTRKPTPQMLKGLDAIVYDLQDIGCRSYTFISTLGLVMEAAAENGVEVIVLDRPNPLGGIRVEGPRLNPKFRTFVGMYDIPYAYGLTVGELARWVNSNHLKSPCKLTIVPMKGWTRKMTWEDTRLAWVPTSPNIPKASSALGYVATGLLGEIGISNGAGDQYPFELIVNEGIDPHRFSTEMARVGFKGVTFEPYAYHPTGRYRSSTFSGVRLKIDPKAEANLTAIAFYAYEYIKKTFPHKNFFKNRTKEPVIMFDKINGDDAPRKALMAGVSATKIIASWQPGVEKWKEEREPYLLYPEDNGDR